MTTRTKRVKQVIEGIKTREEMEMVVETITRATIARDALVAEMDHELTEIRARYEPQVTAYGQEIDRAMVLARGWSDANPGEFGPRRSIEMVHGAVGYRTGTPKLKTLAGWTWDRVLESLRGSNFKEAIRSKEEVDKEFILANRDRISAERMKSIGVKVVQDETFFVDPKREEVSHANR